MATTTKPEMITTASHPFERAGLGKAPFRCVGSYESKYQAIPGDPSCPIQPGSSCDYCGQGIMMVCVIRDANGVEFKVGCDCVHRSGDKALAKPVSAIKAAHVKSVKASRDAAKADELVAILADEQKRAALAAKPHPHAWRAEKGATLLDWAEWMRKHSGATGQAKLLKALRAA